MKKIAINTCCGGFNLSFDGLEQYNVLSGKSELYPWEIERDDPHLIQTIEELGEISYGNFAEIKIVEIPDDVEWEIIENNGIEYIAEKHRKWM